MELIVRFSGWIMIASGLITASMVQAVFAPRAALQSMFGEAIEGPLAEIVVRNWGVLITLVGIALIYGGISSSHTVPILLFAGASKLAFIALVLAQGRRYLSQRAGVAIAIDAVFVLLFGLILFSI
ncbi:hypothetical protein SAMN04488498_101479 [Mesorhizobium albiziae]|uniref:DoxX-like family protein n=2 Tax=Neomesorhizobium albiziae TaxID=335020 RepID=A0A1I3VHH2_9HYPH|nr:hypothetical protein GCM10007937_06440 [Mesorhizobium albiziae]SFJ94818.1 hypothetical protein SAMN04488498_101479 [Mesorhizobium albiziae]